MQDPLIDNTYGTPAFKQRYQVLNPFRLCFKDSALEQEYTANLADNIARQVRLALVLAFALYLNFAFLDYLLVPEKMLQLWGIRAVVCTLFALLFWLSFKPVFKRIHQPIIFYSCMVASFGIFAMLLITDNHYSHYYYAGINLCITWTLFIVGLRFVNALGTVLVIVFCYNLLAFYKALHLPDIISNNFFLMSNAIIGIFAGYTIEQHARWQFYQARVIKNNSNKLHRAMIAASLDAVITIDEKGAAIEFNDAAEAMFGYSRAEALGQSIGALIVPDAMRAQHEEGFQRYRQSGELRALARRVELQAKRKDQSEFPVELTLRQVDLIGRRLVTAYIRDLSAQRDAENEIAQQRAVLQRNEKLASMGTLLSGVAHELNNPLTIVVGQSQLLRETEQDERVLKRAEKIANAAERCVKIVATFLSMAREQPPKRKPVDVNRVIYDVVDLLEYKLREHVIRLELELGAQLPTILADHNQLHQVISNLVINAQQALQDAPQKIIRIVSALTDDGRQLNIKVIDSGCGIEPELRARIFEPFYTTKAVGVGTGLGLSVCNGIIQSHGGSIEYEEHAGMGACFSLYLPVPAQIIDQPVSTAGEKSHDH
ncbi:MAG TPA: ATP-binding protein [Cellvibrio sp.]|nr:ATP-binding protein [Cellvibrio sp.]